MRVSHANRGIIRLVSAIAALVLVLIMGATPALAADGSGDNSQVELTPEQKQKAHDELVPIITDQVCTSSLGGKLVSILPGGKPACAAVVGSSLPKSFESLQAFQESIKTGTFCKALITGAGPITGVAVGVACNLTFNQALSDGINTKITEWWIGFTKAVGAVVGFVEFVSNPGSGLDQIANSLKKDSVNSLGTTLNALSQATDFDAGDPQFRYVWAACAGIGLIVLAGMVLLTLRASAAGKIDGAEATKSLVVWAPIGVLLMVFGPVLGHVITLWLQPINEGLIGWASTPANSAIAQMSEFAVIKSSSLFGPGLGIALWGILFIGSWATFFLMVVWKVALLLMGAGIAVALGMLANPLWRPKAMKLILTFGGVMASKSILLLMLGVGFFLMGIGRQVQPGTNGDLTNIVNVFVVGLILLTVVFFPVLLLKYIPLTPEGSQSSRGGGSVAGAAVMAGGASAITTTIANNRRDSINSHQSGKGGGGNSNTSWTPPQEPTKLSPGGGGGGGGRGYGAQAHRGSTGPGRGSSTGAARAAAPTGAAATGARTAGTAGTAGSVAAGASTAGVATAVQAAIAATNAAAAKTSEAAHSAAPDVPGS